MWDDENYEGEGYKKCHNCNDVMKTSIGYNPISKEDYVYEFCEHCNIKEENHEYCGENK